MGSKILQVIAALEKLHDAASESDRDVWPVSSVNRWISQIPADAVQDTKSLMLEDDGAGDADIDFLLAHVASTIAFLEAADGADES